MTGRKKNTSVEAQRSRHEQVRSQGRRSNAAHRTRGGGDALTTTGDASRGAAEQGPGPSEGDRARARFVWCLRSGRRARSGSKRCQPRHCIRALPTPEQIVRAAEPEGRESARAKDRSGRTYGQGRPGEAATGWQLLGKGSINAGPASICRWGDRGGGELVEMKRRRQDRRPELAEPAVARPCSPGPRWTSMSRLPGVIREMSGGHECNGPAPVVREIHRSTRRKQS